MDGFGNFITDFGDQLESQARHTVGEWVIGPFHYDPSNDSLFWVETFHGDGKERFKSTGAGRQGIVVDGCVFLGDVTFPSDPVTAHAAYLHAVRRIGDVLGM